MTNRRFGLRAKASLALVLAALVALIPAALIASGKVDLKPLISATLPFADSIAGFDRAVEARDTDVKLQIVMPQ